MMHISRFCITACLLLVTGLVMAQPSRQALVAGQTIVIKSNAPAVPQALAIDYQRSNTSQDTIFYNKLLAPGKITVTYANKPSTQTFAFVLAGQVQPLLKVYKVGNQPLTIALNMANTITRVISSVELTIQAPAVLGTVATDTVLTQYNAILNTWGLPATTQQYQRRAKSLDVLSANNQYTPASTIPASAVALSDTLYQYADFDIFSNSVFTNVLTAGLFVTNNTGRLTPQSLYNIQQVYYYVPSLQQAQAVNVYATPNITMPTAFSNTQNLYYQAKQAFYSTSARLIRTDASNKNIKDTFINGARYVLMVAWKNAGFFQYVKPPATSGGLSYYPASSQFFQYPLFLANQYEMQQFVKKNNMVTWPEQQCRTRFKELLGLTPNSTNNVFVEFWVNESDFFRPAIDSSIQCNGLFTIPTNSYLTGLTSYAQGSYSNPNILSQYPFTGLGYTWDCHPGTDHIGVSEFVLRESRNAYIRDSASTMTYIQRLAAQ